MDKQLQIMLVHWLRVKARESGIHLDVYDPDALVQIMQDFLQKNDAALTGTGVRRFRR